MTKCRAKLSVLLLAVFASGPPVGAEVYNRIVLRVNDRIATHHDYEVRRVDMVRELGRSNLPEEERTKLLEEIPKRVFSDLFEELLLLSRADQLQIEITETHLASALEGMRSNMGIDTEEAFVAAIQQSGVAVDVFRKRIRDNLRMREVLGRDVQDAIEVGNEVVRRYYREHPDEFRIPPQVSLREIVILDDSPLSPEGRTDLAAQISQRLAEGAGIEKIAAAQAAGGLTSGVIDLGWVSPGELSPELEGACWDLETGSFSAPVEARGGLHILEIVDRREATLRPFEEVSDRIQGREEQRVYVDKLSQYMTDLETKAYIVSRPPPEARGFRSVTGQVTDEEQESPEAESTESDPHEAEPASLTPTPLPEGEEPSS